MRVDRAKGAERGLRTLTAVAVALLGLAWLVVAATWLAHSSPELLRTNSSLALEPVATVDSEHRACVLGEYIPAGTKRVEVSLAPPSGADVAPVRRSVELEVRVGGSRIQGDGTEQIPGAASVMVELDRALARGDHDGAVCVATPGAAVQLAGDPDGVGKLRLAGGELQRGKSIRLSYFAAGERTRLAIAWDVLERASLFRPGWVSPWVFLLLALLVVLSLVAALTALVLRASGGWPDRRWMFLIATVVLVNGLAWAVVTPPFHAPDEYQHFAYVETLAERGLPGEGTGAFAPDVKALVKLTVDGTALNTANKPPWDPLSERRWRAIDNSSDPRRAAGITSAAQYPPVYYGIAVLPYKLTPGGVIGKSFGLRLFSLLMTIGSALLAFATAREVMPRIAWAAPVVGLVAAFQPMFLHIGSAAHLDAFVIFATCLLVFLVARTLGRGLTLGRAVAIGGVFALAVTAKPVSIGLAPALVVAAWFVLRQDRRPLRDGLRDLLAGAAAAVVPIVAVYLAFPGSTEVADGLARGSAEVVGVNFNGLVSFSWQWFLPRLDSMYDWYGGNWWAYQPPFFRLLVPGFFANFNHLDTSFPFAVFRVATLICLLLLVSLAVGARRRWQERESWLPFASFSLAAFAGVMGFLLVSGYLMAARYDASLIQGRYMLPLITIFGIFIAAGCSCASRRWGSLLAITLVAALALLNLSSYAISLARFYS